MSENPGTKKASKLKSTLIAGAVALFLMTGCESDSSQITEVAEKTDESKESLFSKEQELIKQAQGIETLLAEDAAEKKKAVADELNGK